jgi:RNA polymerase sigma-54 factor
MVARAPARRRTPDESPDVRLGLNQSARLEQRLLQSPQMIQAMQILQLNWPDLQERIEQELVENPLLELADAEGAEKPEGGEGGEGGDGDAAGAPADIGAADAAPSPEPEAGGVENMLEELEHYERDNTDGFRPRGSAEDADKKLEAMANTPDDEKSLAEDLLGELSFLELDARRRRIAEYLLYSLDERGYLRAPLEEIARECSHPDAVRVEPRIDGVETPAVTDDMAVATEKCVPVASAPIDAPHAPVDAARAPGDAPPEPIDARHAPSDAEPAPAETSTTEEHGLVPEVTVAELEEVLRELRRISHPALGARDLKECLLLQIDALDPEQPLLKSIVENHLEDLEQNRLPRIAKATGKTIEAVKQALEALRTLDPSPGAEFGDTRTNVITPDVIVEEIDGEYVVRLDRQRAPELVLTRNYRKILQDAQKGDGTREWVKKRLESARWFIDAIHQRHNTLQRIAISIFARQRGFLERGVPAFKPLRMQEVADEVGVHISTVSRAVSGKYAQTPRGIFPLKYFFAGGTTKDTGEVASQVSIKQRIADLVAQENGEHPLSDEELAALLEERDHVKIARRTVTKYRKALKIPSSNQRRKF